MITKEYRDETKKLLNKFIKNDNNCIKLENSIFEFTNNYCTQNDMNLYDHNIYLDKFNTIYENINGKINNNYLINAINNEELNVENIPYMNSNEIFPDNWKKIINRINLIEDKKKNMATTDIFVCKKCQDNRCTVHMMQTRSADEPMTTFVTCITCNYTWKF